MWEIRIQHEGLKAFKVVKAQTKEDLDLKARLQIELWNLRWKKQQAADLRTGQREQRTNNAHQNKQTADALSVEAGRQIFALDQILKSGLERSSFFHWDILKDQSPFTEVPPHTPEAKTKPSLPEKASYEPQFSILDKLLSSRKRQKEAVSEERFQAALNQWKLGCESIEAENKTARELYDKELAGWQHKKGNHRKKQEEQNSTIDEMADKFLTKDREAIEHFFSEVLARCEYPDTFPQEAHVEYLNKENLLIVDFELPNVAALPKYKEVKYIASRNLIQEVPVSEAWLKKTYDDVLYQIALRTLFEVFVHDYANLLETVVFNGWVNSIDKSTGAPTHGCIMSLQVGRNEFMEIHLEQVEPKACFKKLKGIASSKLVELMPIRPVMSASRDDQRFVTPYAVMATIDERTNLAAMDWLDFENLIREVFEKEFSQSGGEVKITQASRDGGVDAVAFDPDPIRGGKIIIQAKRYTNVVGVSAVRDLYGTVHNEGATKGILVTTATYGPDAYEFAKGKPLTLLSGSELLYLLEKHGHKSKIDIAEAKRINAEAAS